MTGEGLNRQEVQVRIQAAEPRLRGWGVRRLAVFGSVARDEAGPESDIDLLVELEPESKTYDNFLRISDLLEELLGRHVELITTEALSPHIGPHILAEAEDVLRAA